MICLYCDDLSRRSDYQHYYRDRGIVVNAPPPAVFLQAANSEECRGVLFIGEFDPSLSETLRPDMPVFVVGNDKFPGTANYNRYDDPALIGEFNMLSANLYPIRVGQLIFAEGGKDQPVFLCGYGIFLTPTEKSMLAVLVYFRDRARGVSGDELLEFAVGDAHRSSANVSQHISSINKKAAVTSGRTLILSDKNGNYRFNIDS